MRNRCSSSIDRIAVRVEVRIKKPDKSTGV